MTRSTGTVWVAGWLVVFAMGCGSDDHSGEHSGEHAVQGAGAGAGAEDHAGHGPAVVGPPSGALCPPGSTLTYANFGKGFFATYCDRCHAEKVTGAARMNAPADH